MPFAEEDPRVARRRQRPSAHTRRTPTWDPLQWDEPKVKGVPEDHKSKEESDRKTREALKKSLYSKYEKGICSKCRNPMLRDPEGRTFHDVGAIPKGEKCPVGVPVPQQTESQYADLADWERELLEQPLIRTHHESEVDVAYYYYFSLEDISG